MDPVIIAQEGVEKFKDDNFEIIIVDTRYVCVVTNACVQLYMYMYMYIVRVHVHCTCTLYLYIAHCTCTMYMYIILAH